MKNKVGYIDKTGKIVMNLNSVVVIIFQTKWLFVAVDNRSYPCYIY
jgi:hypothetical protein